MDQIAANVYVETKYEGVNVGAMLTPNGAIAVDVPSYPRDARDWATRLHKLDHHPLQFLILSDYNGDRVLNARWMNAPIISQQTTAEKLYAYDKRFPQNVVDSLALRNPEKGRDLHNGPVEKPAMSFSRQMAVALNGYEVQCTAVAGPTDGSCWVYIPEANVLFAGDTLIVDQHPTLTEANCRAWLATLDRLEAMANDGAIIVPGRGPLNQPDSINALRHYLNLLIDRISEHVVNGGSREETAAYIPEFLAMFPIHHFPTDWVKRQVKISLARVYDEIQLEAEGN